MTQAGAAWPLVPSVAATTVLRRRRGRAEKSIEGLCLRRRRGNKMRWPRETHPAVAMAEATMPTAAAAPRMMRTLRSAPLQILHLHVCVL